MIDSTTIRLLACKAMKQMETPNDDDATNSSE